MAANDATAVLVHGAWADGSGWSKVVVGLSAAGVASVAAPLPSTTPSVTAPNAAVEIILEVVQDRLVVDQGAPRSLK